MPYCRVQNGKVIEKWDVAELPPMHPDLVEQYIQCDASVQEGWTDNGDWTFSPPPIVLRDINDIAESKRKEMQSSYESSVSAGFESSALGTPHVYAAHEKAQIDLIGIKACNRARKVWCSDGVAWSMKIHTAAEIEQVINDGADFKESAFEHLLQKEAEIQAILDSGDTYENMVSAINAIAW